ncbi:hypothetical protein PAXRUDRAFT_31081 [Paxillus rubicundulus Ve08.2h10]|uniref:MYND-type domain-containing protein n=1 Tax=Paxillus rubicundulus Ve08.2h10 TaxID=930991 RepID=A0A0D0DV96_9AGAM|nr:hypothetical protein PAXRUDRAFT_31081 [Paxillus rubicundulus Ve08.2h10]
MRHEYHWHSQPLANPPEGCLASFLRKNDPLAAFPEADCDVLGSAIEGSTLALRFAPLEQLPCANHHFNNDTFCTTPGKFPCGACKLVSYCSQKCQREHRNAHKRDCNGPIRSKGGQAARTPQDQPPTSSFPVEHGTRVEPEPLLQKETSVVPLLPTSDGFPAIDIIHLKNNEKDQKRDFSLAFVASGDLRDVMRTVNALGSDYAGHLNIFLNDNLHPVVSRSIILLLLLGVTPNEAVAADMALHFWYSVFLPDEYRLRILAMIVTVLQQQTDKEQPLVVNLGQRSKLTCLVPQEIIDHLLYTAGPTMSTTQARDEYERMRTTPARLDSRDRTLVGLKPSHRLAFLEFWRSGLVLPFGAVNAHFTAPNVSLFSPFGEWLQSSVEDPLTSWDPKHVIKLGQVHGAQPEDVYGCLYFFLSDQLRTFAKRIRELHITFYVFSTDPRTLANEISSGQYLMHGIPSSIRFGRVHVANALDVDCAGVQDVLRSWGPLLAQGDTAAIVGVLMNWAGTRKDGSVTGAGEDVIVRIIDKLVKASRIPPGTNPTTAVSTAARELDAVYDNSKAFSRFLAAQGLGGVLREMKLKRRLKNKIVPHRVSMPIDARSGDLPHLPDDETWYRYMRLSRTSFTARFVEFAPAGV